MSIILAGLRVAEIGIDLICLDFKSHHKEKGGLFVSHKTFTKFIFDFLFTHQLRVKPEQSREMPAETFHILFINGLE